QSLHVDAGLRAAMFLHPAMLGPADGPNVHLPDPASPPTVYVIVNTKLGCEPQAVGDDLVSIGVRSLTLYTTALVASSLREVAYVATRHASPFRYVSVPENLDDGPESGLMKSMFDPSVMSRLYARGEAMAQGTSSQGASSLWHEDPPPE